MTTARSTHTAAHLDGLVRRFGETVAVDGVDLAVADGEIVAIVGPSGCGKSTLLRLVAGLLAPDDGRIVLDGRTVADDRTSLPPEQRRVGVVFQDHSLFPHLTVAENLSFGLTGWDANDRRQRVGEVLDLVDLAGHGGRYPHELSGGERQRIGLARALAPRPALVLLDEPFASLDRNLRTRIRTQTVAILRDARATALFVTHDQTEALAVGDRVAVMRAGRLEQVGAPAAVFHQPANRFVATFLGEADFLPFESEGDKLVTEVGPCPAVAGADPAGEVMIRPHEVLITADPDGQAEVVTAEYRGASVLYDLRLDSGRRLRSEQPHTVELVPGTRVRVSLDHGHVPAVLPPAD